MRFLPREGASAMELAVDAATEAMGYQYSMIAARLFVAARKEYVEMIPPPRTKDDAHWKAYNALRDAYALGVVNKWVSDNKGSVSGDE